MAMPSETAIVVNSTGTPPAPRTPSLAAAASRFRWTLHGVTSFHEEATPTCGLSKSSSVNPTARSMARAGARSTPSVTSVLRGRSMFAQGYRLSSAPMDVGYQGETGAFSEEAVRSLFPEAKPSPRRTVRAVFDAIAHGDVAAGVVPLENSLAGSINETYDLLARGNTHIVGETVIAVDHALLALPGTTLQEVKRVSSHPQALAQCEVYLAELDVELLPVYDTAGAANRIVEEEREGEAAIASERAAELYGLDVLARKIQTNLENQTRFAAISEDPTPLGLPDKTSIILVTGNKPGALYHCLGPFAERDLNLVKLESRPVGHTPWRYRFFLDVEAATEDPAFAEALDEVEREAAMVQVLESYARWRENGP